MKKARDESGPFCRWVACGPERFPAKRKAGSRQENASNQNLEPRSDFIGTDKALAQHAANDAADEASGAGGVGTGRTVLPRLRLSLRLSLRLAAGTALGGTLLVTGTRRRCGSDNFAQQRLVLQPVEVAALGIAAGGLPARNHAAGSLIELAGGLGVEAEPGEAALHVASLALVEADLILGGLVRFLLEGRGIDARGQVAGGVGLGTGLKRGNARQGQRAELTVGIVAQIGVELFRLVGILDRAPELQFHVRCL